MSESPITDPVFAQDADESGNFAAHYQQHIRPQVDQFEQRRKEHLHKLQYRLTYGLMALIFLLPMQIVVHLLLINTGGHDYIAILSLLIYGAICLWMWQPIRNYKSAIKQDIFPHIFSFFGADYSYSEYGNLPMESLRASQILPAHDTAISEDYVRGSYKGVTLETQ